MTTPAPSKKPLPQLNLVHVHAIGAVGVLALAGVAYAFGYAPSAQARHQAELQRQAIAKATDEAGATAEYLRQAEAELLKLQDSTAAGGPGLDELPDAAAALAGQNALLAPRVTEGARGAVDGLTRAQMVVQASGSFSDIAGFFGALPATLPGVAVDGFSIVPDPADDSVLAFQASLSAYAPQAASSAATASESAVAAPAAARPVR